MRTVKDKTMTNLLDIYAYVNLIQESFLPEEAMWALIKGKTEIL